MKKLRKEKLLLKKVNIHNLNYVSKIKGGSSAYLEPTERFADYISLNEPVVLC
jgi:hypothetical protein